MATTSIAQIASPGRTGIAGAGRKVRRSRRRIDALFDIERKINDLRAEAWRSRRPISINCLS